MRETIIFVFIFTMKILLIDNNDSFTYNLLHLIKSACDTEDFIKVCLIDKLTVAITSGFDRIIISPGPGIPSEVEILGSIIKENERRMPILGVCLGHQAIAEYYGATICEMEKPVHGVRSSITITGDNYLFQGVDKKFFAGRYHSWCVSKESVPDCLNVTALDDEENIMALSHREHNVHGVQFHPESFMTDCGKTLISNFLNGARR